MRNNIVRLVSALLTAAALASPGMAAAASDSTGDQQKPSFKAADTNGDGAVSISEATSAGASKSEAKRADLDDDGKLTKQDWRFVEMAAKKSSS